MIKVYQNSKHPIPARCLGKHPLSLRIPSRILAEGSVLFVDYIIHEASLKDPR
jgi:hypothetical protein